MRAQEHQKAITGRRRIRTYGDGTQIEVVAGPKPGGQYRRTDPPKHGERLDARGYLLRDLADLGITDPNDDIIHEYSRLLRRAGGNRPVAKAALAENLEKIMKRAVEQMKDSAAHGVTYVDSDLQRVDPNDVKAIKSTKHPTVEEWDELTAKAKKRKRGVAKFAEKAGYKIVADDADPKQRENWIEA